ncbi:protein involved in gliding motility GldI [Lutibacter sp. Hel_I_33_5]|uniref:gliding motility-associated peptidyl-prolyl isomerase GldI n=1 Tax=Lutibacter sp. Hel_I_33_5 TaxID=1566289 RepID=UPI0011ADC0C8|nr:gliding motility-associated peptidyl-prolyl isomerase GldI [Lutibacter sp. Hel_I_33_5]TVZ57366.1 protein involved in gliding motility GldI [Lutibacter sp. Hel_I_33_5]
MLFISCNEPIARRPISTKKSTILKASIEENKALNKIEEDKITAFIKKDSLQTYYNSSMGFWYAYHTKVETETPTPKFGEEVTISFDIKDLSGNSMYPQQEKKYTIDKEDFITGLQHGIKLMKVGETITFVIPSYNAFGVAGDGNKIGINQSIKSTLTLIHINNKQ